MMLMTDYDLCWDFKCFRSREKDIDEDEQGGADPEGDPHAGGHGLRDGDGLAPGVLRPHGDDLEILHPETEPTSSSQQQQIR